MNYRAKKGEQTMTISCLQGGQAIAQLSRGTKTNLEIQKILYFANMLCIGKNGKEEPLIEDEFLVWPFGPVVRKLYNLINEYGNKPVPLHVFNGIERIMNEDKSPTDEKYTDAVEFINEAYNNFDKYSPFELVRISHWSKGAWKRSKNMGLEEISNELILDEFNARTQ